MRGPAKKEREETEKGRNVDPQRIGGEPDYKGTDQRTANAKTLERALKVNVFIADASRMSCQLLSDALRRRRYGLYIVGYAMELGAIRPAFIENKVDVALISASLKDGALAGFNAARELRDSYPHTKVIMILDSMERPMVVEAFRAGARGILSREEPFEVLYRCIRAVNLGQVWANSKEMQFALEALAEAASSPPRDAGGLRGPTTLTKREEGVVWLVAQGLTNREISRKLNLSENTVRNYLFRIFNKVGTSTRVELALYAISRKEGEPKPPIE